MSFKFNFSETVSDHHSDELHSGTDSTNIEPKLSFNNGNIVSASKFVSADAMCQLCKGNSMNENTCQPKIGTSKLLSPDLKSIEKHIKECCSSSDISKAIDNETDLVKSKYEGGLNIWECGVDLADFLSSENINLTSKRVIEIGCGIGFPGIMALNKSAEKVVFQDFNLEVLEHLTYSCISMNVKDDCPGTFELLGGDWQSLPDALQSDKFDVILTAETIYNPENYNILHDLFDKLLAEDGLVYCAAKTTYFGVGGSTEEFMDFLKTRQIFQVETVKEIMECIPRSILKITKISDQSHDII